MMEKIIQKIQKLKALAEKGVDEEAKSAQRKLDLLLEKYGINLAQLEDESRKERFVKYKSNQEKMLIVQIVSKLLGSEAKIFGVRKGKRKVLQLSIQMNEAEYIDFTEYFHFYRKLFAKDLEKIQERYFLAFIHKHHLFSQDAPSETTEEEGNAKESTMSFEEYAKIQEMMDDISDQKFYKMIG
jgi:hypothetical protein